LLAPRPTPITEDQASVFISPRGRVATHFSRLLRHAWVTVGQFLFPGHRTLGSKEYIILGQAPQSVPESHKTRGYNTRWGGHLSLCHSHGYDSASPL
jgi:hypothetical protein